MSPALNGSSAILHFERTNAIKIHDGVSFDFYSRLPHIKEQPDLSHIYNSTAKLLEHQQIQKAIAMKLTKSEAHLEFVLCAPRIEALFSINQVTILCQSSQQSPAGYFNRKGWHSIILREPLMLAVKYIRTLDGQVVYMMHMFFLIPDCIKRGQNNSLFSDLKQNTGKDVPLVMLSDPTCPLSHESLPQ